MTDNVKGLLAVLLASAGYGAAAPVAKLVYQFGVTPNFLLAARFVMASAVLWAYIFINRRRIAYRLDVRQALILATIGGGVYFLITTCYFDAINYIPVSLLVMIFYTYPVIVHLFSFFVLKEAITKTQVSALIVAFIGVLLMLSLDSLDFKIFGLALAFASAALNAVYYLMLGLKKIHGLHPVVTAAYINVSCAFSFSLCCIVKNDIYTQMPLSGWAGIAFIAIFSTAAAILALSVGVRLIGASKASIIGTFEPVEGVILCFLFLGETMNVRQICGMLLILSAIFLLNKSSNNTQ